MKQQPSSRPWSTPGVKRHHVGSALEAANGVLSWSAVPEAIQNNQPPTRIEHQTRKVSSRATPVISKTWWTA
jgi:hypothetical protein